MNRPGQKNRVSFFFIAGVLMFVSEIWKQFTINCMPGLSGGDGYRIWYLPFQLCSTPMYVCLLLFGKGKQKDACLTYLSTYGLLAGIMAFFDTGGFTELAYLPLSVHSYVWHGLLILLGITAFMELPVKERDFLGASVFFLGFLLVAEILNISLTPKGSINMFYINPLVPMRQKYFSDIAAYLTGTERAGDIPGGNLLAILVYVASIFTGACTLDILELVFSQKMRNKEG